jgi:glycosyltransferase involved in cell wall biosynthesis
MKKKIIFSAINVTSGGPLTILEKFLEFAAHHLLQEYDVWFLIKDKSYLTKTYPGIHLLEFRDSQRTLFHKLYYEYFFFLKFSKHKKPYLWISLNDCSPNVEAEKRAVYVHNATPFYKFSLMDLLFPSRILLQRFYYNFFLKTNLEKNTFVIVQQRFMKDHVTTGLGFSPPEHVLLHRPSFSISMDSVMTVNPAETPSSSIFLIYPAKPEVYKNVHRLTAAAIKLIEQESFSDFTLWLTITGTENRYSRYIARLSQSFPQIVFKGQLSFPVLMGHVQASDILVFPSKLETWGLPLSEAAFFNKWIVASDLPYARETLDGYKKVFFFDPNSTEDLMDKILQCVEQVKNQAREVTAQIPAVQQESGQDLSFIFKTILQSN